MARKVERRCNYYTMRNGYLMSAQHNNGCFRVDQQISAVELSIECLQEQLYKLQFLDQVNEGPNCRTPLLTNCDGYLLQFKQHFALLLNQYQNLMTGRTNYQIGILNSENAISQSKRRIKILAAAIIALALVLMCKVTKNGFTQ